MRNWTWLLPCWIWRYNFFYWSKDWLHLENGEHRDYFRIDDEFILVRHPSQAYKEPKAVAWRRKQRKKIDQQAKKMAKKLDALKQKRQQYRDE